MDWNHIRFLICLKDPSVDVSTSAVRKLQKIARIRTHMLPTNYHMHMQGCVVRANPTNMSAFSSSNEKLKEKYLKKPKKDQKRSEKVVLNSLAQIWIPPTTSPSRMHPAPHPTTP